MVFHVSAQGASIAVALVTSDELAGEWFHAAVRHHVAVAKQQCNKVTIET